MRRVANAGTGALRASRVAAMRPAFGGSAVALLARQAPQGLAAARSSAAPSVFGAFRPLSVSAAAGDHDEPRSEAPQRNTLFVGNLPWSVDDGVLKGLFSEFQPTDSKVMFDNLSGRSKGIAFVNFDNAEAAERAQAALNGKEVDGRPIRVEPRLPPGTPRPIRDGPPRERSPRSAGPRFQNDDRKLYVGNLAWAVDGLDLEDIFKEFGTVESAQVVTDKETGRSKGFGFVVMATKDESDKAKKELSGANVDGRTIVVDFASRPEVL